MLLAFKPDPANTPEIRLPPKSRCIYCGEAITLAREVPTARQTWELVEPLRPDADTINVERHLPTQFQLAPPRPEASGLFPPGYHNNILGMGGSRPRDVEVYGSSYPGKAALPSPTFGDLNSPGHPGAVSPQSPSPYQSTVPLRSEPSRPDMSSDQKRALDETESSLAHLDPSFLTDPPPFSRDSPALRRQTGLEDAPSIIHTPRTVPLITSAEKGKSRWRLKFTASKKAPVTSGDSSSLSSTALEAQRLEEVSLSGLLNTQKAHTRGKPSKNINVHLSQNSNLGLFWTQLLIHVWDVGTSPPTMMRAILPESTCILAAVAKLHLAYIIGTRDQKLTVSAHLVSLLFEFSS